MSYEIAHVTTVHRRDDTRIRWREVASLAELTDWSARLIVQDGQGDRDFPKKRLNITDIGASKGGRVSRAIIGSLRMWRQIRRIRPVVVHFHDPELIPLGICLKLVGATVIYDVHEDYPRMIVHRKYLPRKVAPLVSKCIEGLERVVDRLFDGIVVATPRIGERFSNRNTVLVQNFPMLNELDSETGVAYRERSVAVGYVGGITALRGGIEMARSLNAMRNRKACLELVGTFKPEAFKDEVLAETDPARVLCHGWSGRKTVAEILGRVRAGLVVLHPTENYPESYPVKMFEYMAAGIPVVASDFPLWREIIEGARCGVVVNPLDPVAIASEIDWILENPDEAEKMGRRGKLAVEQEYNWEAEERKLIALYEKLVGWHRSAEKTERV